MSPPKAVFALTSEGRDFYGAMTRVAVASLRLTNPGLGVVVACDADTDRALKRAQDPLLDEVDDWLITETPAGDARFRNRFVKTTLRATLEGPFLFLDSDILVRGDLSEIFALETDIAGARNHSLEAFDEQVWEPDGATLKAMGWQISGEVYINGGVLFYNDTPGARYFGAEWHRRWRHSFETRGSCRDQPALNAALHATRPRLIVLPDRFNAQFKRNLNVICGAALWHYYASAFDIPHTRYELVVHELLQGNTLDKSSISTMINNPHPWRRQSIIDDWAATQVMKRGCFDGWAAAWLRREIPQSAYRRIRGMFRALLKFAAARVTTTRPDDPPRSLRDRAGDRERARR